MGRVDDTQLPQEGKVGVVIVRVDPDAVVLVVGGGHDGARQQHRLKAAPVPRTRSHTDSIEQWRPVLNDRVGTVDGDKARRRPEISPTGVVRFARVPR